MSDPSDQTPADPRAKAPETTGPEAGARSDRLAAALRRNLHRRKAQRRARNAAGPATSAAAPDTPPTGGDQG